MIKITYDNEDLGQKMIIQIKNLDEGQADGAVQFEPPRTDDIEDPGSIMLRILGACGFPIQQERNPNIPQDGVFKAD